MSTFNVYIGDSLVMEKVPDYDVKHKLEYLREYFKHYPDDELRKEEIKVIKNEKQEN
tara:strand:- start:1093 stop:1263 length:171 start_codon:yes stop_codon:yes gene_type:complete